GAREEARDRPTHLAAARLGDDVADPALGLAVRRPEAAGLHLDFLDERGIDADAQRPVHAREDAETAEGGVGDVDAVGDVGVVERGAAGDGRVGLSATLALRDTR